MPEMDDQDWFFEGMFQKFVEVGGLDTPQSEVRSEDLERVYLSRDKHEPRHCVHGATELTCGHCYFHGYQRPL